MYFRNFVIISLQKGRAHHLNILIETPAFIQRRFVLSLVEFGLVHGSGEEGENVKSLCQQ